MTQISGGRPETTRDVSAPNDKDTAHKDAGQKLSAEGNQTRPPEKQAAHPPEPAKGVLVMTNPYAQAQQKPGDKDHDKAQPKPAGDDHGKAQPKPEGKNHEKSIFDRACSWASGAVDVAEQVAVGAAKTAYKEVTEHPGQTLLHVAEGVAVGVAIVAAAPVLATLGAGAAVVGAVAVAADVAMVGMGVAGVAMAGKDVVHAANTAGHAADVLMHKEGHTAKEIAAARGEVQDKTGGAAISAVVACAGVVGGVASGAKVVAAAGRIADCVATGAESTGAISTGLRAEAEVAGAGAGGSGGSSAEAGAARTAPGPKVEGGAPSASTPSETPVSGKGSAGAGEKAPGVETSGRPESAPKPEAGEKPAGHDKATGAERPTTLEKLAAPEKPPGQERVEWPGKPEDHRTVLEKHFTKEEIAKIDDMEKTQQSMPITELTPEESSALIEQHYGDGAAVKGKRLDLVLGPPGSGKSSVLVNPLAESNGSLIIDADAVKPNIRGYADGLGADAVHDASSEVSKGVLRKAIQNGDNIVVPKLGKSPASVEGLIEAARLKGYEVHVHLSEVPPETAARRTFTRAFPEDGSLGQWVNPKNAVKTGAKPTETFYDLINRPGYVDGYSHYNNNVPFGVPPVLVNTSMQAMVA